MSAPEYNAAPTNAPPYDAPQPYASQPYAPQAYAPQPSYPEQPHIPAVYNQHPLVPTGPRPVADGLQMKQRNPLAVWLGLPLITLGIYTLVWQYKIHSELGMFDRRRIVGAVGPVLAWIFGGFTLMIWPLISTYNTGQTIAATQRSAGLPATCSGLLGLLLVFVFGTHTLYYQIELNKIVAANAVPEGTQVPLWA